MTDHFDATYEHYSWLGSGECQDAALDAIQRAHLSLPEDADYERRRSAVEARYPFGLRIGHPYDVWRRCRREYMSKLWPGRPAKPLDAESTPLFFATPPLPHQMKRRPNDDR